ncbi:MAG TPA: DUF547 domain-containing protein [Oculatellaceae cyanobacterium]
MPFFKRAKLESEERPPQPVMIPVVVGVVVCLLVLGSIFRHIPLMLESMFINVQHPLIYKFPAYSKLLPQIVKYPFVDYQQIQKSKLLDEAVSELAKTSPEDLEDDKQRFTFWINAYNMLVLKAIMEKYPLERLNEKSLTRSFSSTRYFVGGRGLSLEEIKRYELFPRLHNKPTALFLICNGAIGSPPLLDHAITAETFDEDAENAARKFVNDKHNVSYDPDHKTFVVSPLLKWNEELFAQYGGPAEFANKYRKSHLDLHSIDVLFVSFARNFNWFLNDLALQKVEEDDGPIISPAEPEHKPESNPEINPENKPENKKDVTAPNKEPAPASPAK